MKHAREDYNRIQDPENKIPEDEPVFLIRGQDQAGPATLRYWADQAENLGADYLIVRAARQQAIAMEKWHESNSVKVPDMPNP